jgi:glycosyltransferase A (GT-A) superfamily protein (DUF2064 family)
MSPVECAILVVAKAPVAGQVKTRLVARFGPEGAAELAAASLLDTLVAVRSADVTNRIVAITGDLTLAHRSDEITSMLADFTVIPQKGRDLPERLVEAHIDAAALAAVPVLQIGMDTPQAGPDLLTSSAAALAEHTVDAVLGPATDGGWWAVGVSAPGMASVLGGITMSRADTGAKTLVALRGLAITVFELPTVTDVDTPDDVWLVASALDNSSYFRQAAVKYRPAQ